MNTAEVHSSDAGTLADDGNPMLNSSVREAGDD